MLSALPHDLIIASYQLLEKLITTEYIFARIPQDGCLVPQWLQMLMLPGGKTCASEGLGDIT